ncbi:outer membrane protein assembly factor BamA [Rhodoplanes sp. Z2-YC6860]|uniref:outer membrane protein assembly factor BamA n=1 Tax=Rhodoplanes sp. Z2-YC6860 TaxID=674703 RepID=UPI00078C7312|nr:outer membrane protein assembly factor BamA [Rhodoplanes sp. Z2-YC6860]AMN42345.1 Beta-barrel assembly machine subunit BamA [Rhodoplanes sp. Z2-YC6860]
MTLWVRWLRGLCLVGAVLSGGILAAGFGAVATSTHAFAQASQIVVEGNRRVEAETVRSYFRTNPGERLDSFKIDQALKALYATGLFQDVRINQSGGRLVVTVIENPVINRVAFEGNKKIKDDQLANEVQSRARGTLSRPTVQADVQRVVEIYRRNGRFDIRVEPKIIDLPNNRVDLVFEIHEGEKTGVKKIIFVGNKSYGDQRLKDEIKTQETFWLFSFLQQADIYDPDRIEADRDLLRRFYLKHGFADVRVVSAVSVYDPTQKGFIVTYTIEEGDRYKFGKVNIQSNISVVEPNGLYSRLRAAPGAIYNAEAVEKSVENLSIEVARRGYPFAVVRPNGDRDPQTKTINVAFVIDDGPRIYIERINVRGNTRTRDYVIRREFDVGEGDAYNRALIDRAERRLKNLNYFKNVKITNEPGSAPDRIVINVDVEEQPTGEFSIAGGYSTADGAMAELSVAERNLLGQGQYARFAVQYGQRARGFELSFAEPFFMGYRLGVGVDLYAKQTLASNYISYDSSTIGIGLRAGFQLSEELSFQARYNIYRQEITLPDYLNNCQFSQAALDFQRGIGPGVQPSNGCYSDGEASLAVRKELAAGPVLVSMLGYTLAYSTLDNNRNPTSGLYAELKQDFAGVGGDVNFIRTTGEMRTYHELFSDVVGVFKLQGGNIAGWGSKDLRMLDHFQMGPNLVRGFAPAGIGPRDLLSTNQDPLGGTMFWGASVEAQAPFSFLPKDAGLKGAVFADVGSLWDYKGPTTWDVTGEKLNPADTSSPRASVGVGLIWNSPFGPLRFDYAVPLLKQDYDRVQQFRFGGGTKF